MINALMHRRRTLIVTNCFLVALLIVAIPALWLLAVGAGENESVTHVKSEMGIRQGYIYGLATFLSVFQLLGMSQWALWLWIIGQKDSKLEIKVARLQKATLISTAMFVAWALVIFSLLVSEFTASAIVPSVLLNAYALAILRRSQRNRKTAWSLIGLTILTGPIIGLFASAGNVAYIISWTSHLHGVWSKLATSGGIAIYEEGLKALAIAIIVAAFYRRVNDTISGIVIGVGVGIGFNLAESVMYASIDKTGAYFQIWTRQVLGLPLGHATFSGLIGAAIGIALSRSQLKQKVMMIAGGYLLAVLAHFAWDAAAFLEVHKHFEVSQSVQTYIVLPLMKLVVTGPFALVLVWLFIKGTRQQQSALRTEMAHEIYSESGVVEWEEADVLISPTRRGRTRMRALFGFGFQHYRELARLQKSQIELLMWRWKERETGQIDEAQQVQRRHDALEAKSSAAEVFS